MAPVHGRVSSYVSMEKGAASPGRWQLWQFFCRIGATSFVNVGACIFPICAERYSDEQNAKRKAVAVRFIALTPLRGSSSYPRSRLRDHIKNLPRLPETLRG